MKHKIMYIVLILIAMSLFIILLFYKNFKKSAKQIVTKPSHSLNISRVITPNIYHGDEIYTKFKANHKNNQYKNIENSCLKKEIIHNLFDEYENNLREIVKHQAKSDIPDDVRINIFISNIENSSIIMGIIVNKYLNCQNIQQSIEIRWKNVVMNSNDDELWYAFLAVSSYWNDNFINEIIICRLDNKITNYDQYWSLYLTDFAKEGTIKTAIILKELSEKNPKIPDKANDYKNCSKIIRNRIENNIEWPINMTWSHWWEKQK